MISANLTQFTRPKFDVLGDGSQEVEADAIKSLPDLIFCNARKNPDHTFCLQAEAKTEDEVSNSMSEPFSLLPITFRQLANAVDACATILKKTLPENCLLSERDTAQGREKAPVALLVESDVGLFVYLATLLAMQIPVVLLSARLSETSVRHLLKETGAERLLVSKRTKHAIEGKVEDLVSLQQTLPYRKFFEAQEQDQHASVFSRSLEIDSSSAGALILHSSGTTGLPKPIRLAQRYLLGYAACHEISEQEDVSLLNLSTLPLYHGFGLLAPCLSLSIGMTCCFPPSSIVPAAHSMVELLSMIEVQSLMTVPSILEDMINLPEEEANRAMTLLRPLQFVAVGGGPLKPSTAEHLVDWGVRVLNHYGATEIGAIAPIFRPDANYDWHYLRLRKDLGLRLQPVAELQTGETRKFKLVGKPFGWDREFQIQDELEFRKSGKHTEVRVIGRIDNVIVLKTGEKVDPRLLEDTLSKDSRIKSAICVGQGQFELIVLVEPSNSAPKDIEIFREEIWSKISSINSHMDKHAQISSKNAIVPLFDDSKPIPRSDKGSLMRREAHNVFEKEIENAYFILEKESSYSVLLPTNTPDLEFELQKILKAILGVRFDNLLLQPSDDFFELGMDSLHAVRLARALKASLIQTTGDDKPLKEINSRFIYQNPSINQLATSLSHQYLGGSSPTIQSLPRDQRMQKLLAEYLATLRDTMKLPLETNRPTSGKERKPHVLLTGSTGNLGSHVVAALAANPDIQKIYCVNRCPVSQSLDEAISNLEARQKAASTLAGVNITPEAWAKIEFIPLNTRNVNTFHSTLQHENFVKNVTHIVHLAWPMDFQRTLSSFRPQLDLLIYLIGLANAIHLYRPSYRPKLLFSSSISVVRNYKQTDTNALVTEQTVTDPLATTPMGYAEAKWVCEQLLEHTLLDYPTHLDPQIVRIGQLSGPVHDGIWKTEEHIPTLFKISQEIGAFPKVSGNYSWIPVDTAANALLDIVLSSRSQPSDSSLFYHLENPIRQPFSDLAAHATYALQLTQQPIPFAEWLERLKTSKGAEKFASLLEFFTNDFADLASGEVILDTRVSRAVSATLRSCDGLDADLIGSYVQRWRRMGFLT